jgi:hypothetical protein
VAEDRRGQRPARGGSGAGRGSSSGGGRSGSSPRGRGSRDDQPPGRGGSSRGGYQGGKAAGGKPSAGNKPGERAGGRRSSSSDQRGFRGRTDDHPRTADQAAYDGPDLPEHITGAELDRGVRAQLKGLPEKLAARVARHLAAAGAFIDEDPELAYRHALAARARASRIAVVREAAGETAYAAGHYAEALS